MKKRLIPVEKKV